MRNILLDWSERGDAKSGETKQGLKVFLINRNIYNFIIFIVVFPG